MAPTPIDPAILRYTGPTSTPTPQATFQPEAPANPQLYGTVSQSSPVVFIVPALLLIVGIVWSVWWWKTQYLRTMQCTARIDNQRVRELVPESESEDVASEKRVLGRRFVALRREKCSEVGGRIFVVYAGERGGWLDVEMV